MILGLLGAFVAALAYGAATILQAVGVSRMAAVHVDEGLVARGRAGALYAAGLALDGVGFLASIAALRTLPLFLVQSAIASSVAVTALLAVVVLKSALSHRETAAIAATVGGLILLALSAREGAAHELSSGVRWTILGIAPLLALALVTGIRMRKDHPATLLLSGVSGLGFGLVGIAARTMHVASPWWRSATDPGFLAILAFGLVSLVAYGYALHRGRVTTVAAVTFVVETIVPATVGLVWLGDAVRPHLAPLAFLGFAATLIGSVALASHAEPQPTHEDAVAG